MAHSIGFRQFESELRAQIDYFCSKQLQHHTKHYHLKEGVVVEVALHAIQKPDRTFSRSAKVAVSNSGPDESPLNEIVRQAFSNRPILLELH